MIEREKIEKFYSCISGAKKVVLFGHVNPDGDSIGSLSGMYDFLANNGIEAERIVPGAYPGFLAFLDPEKKIMVYNDEKEKALSAVKEADLMVCLDFNSFSRIDEIGEAASRSAAVKILIDHHLFPDKSFDLTISDTEVSSTCELVYIVIEELLKLYPAAPLSLAGETALYTGIMTDTNNFANSVRPDTFRIASLLMEHGVDKTAVQQFVFGGFSEESDRRDSNPRSRPWQGRALPTTPLSHLSFLFCAGAVHQRRVVYYTKRSEMSTLFPKKLKKVFRKAFPDARRFSACKTGQNFL